MAEQREWKNGKPGKLAGQKLKSLLVIQYILKHADEDHPVTIADIQNHLGKYGIEAERRSIYRDIYDLLDLLNAEAGEAVFGFCFDVGHANITGRNLGQDVRTLGHRLTVLHIHDNNGARDLHMVPFSQRSADGGTTDWEGFITALQEIGYTGPLNFETFAAVDQVPEALQPALLRYIGEIGRYFASRLG
jgi:sugar phosphate isomerase/epimerase